MRLACFYHCWAAGRWQQPLVEHLAALESSRFPGPIFLGVVGSAAQRDRAVRLCESLGRPVVVVAADDAGYEQTTINALRRYSVKHDGAVLYAHTKGARNQSEVNVKWRGTMTRRVVTAWEGNLRLLQEGADAVGCHWLTPVQYWWWGVVRPHFGGNFWMARTSYLRKLPECPAVDRFDAELWIGGGSPVVVDLQPGLPDLILSERARTSATLSPMQLDA